MDISPKTVALINLSIQIVLFVAVLTAAYLVKLKKKEKVHCAIIRVTLAIQIVTTILVMWPSLTALIRRGERGFWFNAEVLIHHSIGVILFLLFIAINLAFWGFLPARIKLVPLMRTAFTLWLISIAIGVHTFFQLWT